MRYVAKFAFVWVLGLPNFDTYKYFYKRSTHFFKNGWIVKQKFSMTNVVEMSLILLSQTKVIFCQMLRGKIAYCEIIW